MNPSAILAEKRFEECRGSAVNDLEGENCTSLNLRCTRTKICQEPITRSVHLPQVVIFSRLPAKITVPMSSE